MKDIEFEKRFLYIERDLIREGKFSIAKSELEKIIHDTKIKNLGGVLDRARILLRFCNSKEHGFSKKIDENNHLSDEEVSALLMLIKEQLSKAKNLVHQKKALEAKEILEKVISEGKKIKEIVHSSEKEHSFSININQAEDLLDYCDNFLQNKENLMNIKELIEEKEFLKANVDLKDLIEEIKTYIGEKKILHEEILNKALNLFKEDGIQDIEKDIILKKKLIEEDISKAKNLIYQKKISDGIKLLESVIQESKSFSESFSNIIFSQASDILDYCQDFKKNKNNLIKIKNLIEEKKFSTAKNRLQDLLDEIETYLGDKAILSKEILSEALILLRENIKHFPEGYMSEYSEDILIELKKEIEKYNIKTLVQNANSITELNYYLPKRSEFLNKLYNVYINSDSEYEPLFKTELTKLIIQFYTPYLEINPFEIKIERFINSFFSSKSSEMAYFQRGMTDNTKIKEFFEKIEENQIKFALDYFQKIVNEINLKTILNSMTNISEVSGIGTTKSKIYSEFTTIYNHYRDNEEVRKKITDIIVQYYSSYLEINPFKINVQYFPRTYISWIKNDIRNLQNISKNNDEILDLCKKLKDIDFNTMFDNELKRISERTYELNYDILLEDLYNYLLDFSQVIPSPDISKTQDSTEDDYILKIPSIGRLKFKIIEKEKNKKLLYEYDCLNSIWGEKGKFYADFIEPSPGKVILKVRNEIQEIAQDKREQMYIYNSLGAHLQTYLDFNIGKIVAKQVQTIFYEKSFDDLTMGNYRILRAKFNVLGKDINELKTRFFEVKSPLTLKSFECSECGATLNITSKDERFIICDHCSTPFLMDWQKDKRFL